MPGGYTPNKRIRSLYSAGFLRRLARDRLAAWSSPGRLVAWSSPGRRLARDRLAAWPPGRLVVAWPPGRAWSRLVARYTSGARGFLRRYARAIR